jgi:4-hydroxythreonine-4-phosphate dehydrogenase
VSNELPIIIAAGDPGAAFAQRSALRSVIFGDAAQLRREAELLDLEVARLHRCDESKLDALPFGDVGVVDTGRVSEAVIAQHAPVAEAGLAQLHTLQRAACTVQAGRGRALVTGPTSKEAIVRAGHAFIGQTEFLARLDGRADDDVSMLFLGPRLRVGLVTTHLSIADVPRAVTIARVVRTVRHLGDVLVRLYPERAPSLAVSGLNPHAGEGTLFGTEERDVVMPALAALRGEPPFREGGVTLVGPVPAEAVFRAAQRGDVDGVVAMFHDQATIASKLLDWGAAVNTTWGLSFLRTSVDHGVAYDAARAGTADADGMHAALALALRLTADGGADG